ncbi:MAG: prolyl oligopeptidase family serine peptidase, partial [Gammaproteobacteria bacterium]|nr:prolyl oligopeptidase family serine peptidase [Gammaproteobacteria bacterium]
ESSGDEDVKKPLDEVLARISFGLKKIDPNGVLVRTFRSTIDGSTQAYAVQPAGPLSETESPAISDMELRTSMILALHDKGETCWEFAQQMSRQDWADVVAPMGRRPYGFDWEDWSRIDALEVLADAQLLLNSDPNRTFLMGYAMGGHGTWHLGVTYPARFAAIGPIAGWASYWSYGGGMPIANSDQPIQEMLMRGYSPSDTLKLIGNLRETGVCIQHGSEDNVVPVAQSRYMRSRLADFHSNFAYFEEQGVGHEATRDMCNSQQMLEFFQAQSQENDASRDSIDYVTAHPGIGHGVDWVSIEAQRKQFRPSRVAISRNSQEQSITAKTINVSQMSVQLDSFANQNRRVRVSIDGQSLGQIEVTDTDSQLWFENRSDRWFLRNKPPLSEKG